MSGTNEPEPVGLHDPMHDVPRRLRGEPEQRSAAAHNIRAMRENRTESIGRTMSPLAPLDSQFKSAMHEALLRPPDSHAMAETRALAREIEQRDTLFRVTVRKVAAIGVSGIIALFFLIMMPAVRQPDSTQSFVAAVQSFTTALSQQHQSEDTPTPALAEFYSLLASGGTAQAAERGQSEKQSDKMLQQFLHWRQKGNPSEAAQ